MVQFPSLHLDVADLLSLTALSSLRVLWCYDLTLSAPLAKLQQHPKLVDTFFRDSEPQVLEEVD